MPLFEILKCRANGRPEAVLSIVEADTIDDARAHAESLGDDCTVRPIRLLEQKRTLDQALGLLERQRETGADARHVPSRKALALAHFIAKLYDPGSRARLTREQFLLRAKISAPSQVFSRDDILEGWTLYCQISRLPAQERGA